MVTFLAASFHLEAEVGKGARGFATWQEQQTQDV